MKRIVVITRSMNGSLYDAAMSFLEGVPGDRVRLTETDAKGYFCEAMRYRFDYDWILNIDEDAFLSRPDLLVDLLNHMEEHGYDYCGMPDGGVDPIREHNPFCPNAFFNLFRTEKLRSLDFSNTDIDSSTLDPQWLEQHEGFIDSLPEEYRFDEYEPYYRFFFYLLRNECRPLHLNATKHSDGTTSILEYCDEPLCFHTWYSREYFTDRRHRERIDSIIEEVRNLTGTTPV